MELRHLRYFTAVAAEGNFNRAAGKLNLTQPTLSRQVKDLEEELGVTLVKRSANSVSLTELGEVFYAEALDVLARADQAVQRIRERGAAVCLRVGYNPSLTSGIMPRAIERFHAAAPHVRLELSDLAPGEMIELAEARRIDLLIAPEGIESALSDYSWLVLHKLKPVLVLSSKHPLARQEKVAPDRLRRLTLLGLDRKDFPEYSKRMRELFRPFGFAPHFDSAGADGVMTLFANLEARNGATILSEGIAAMLPPALVIRPFAPRLAPIVIKLGLPLGRPNPHAETFARLLQEAVTQRGAAKQAGAPVRSARRHGAGR